MAIYGTKNLYGWKNTEERLYCFKITETGTSCPNYVYLKTETPSTSETVYNEYGFTRTEWIPYVESSTTFYLMGSTGIWQKTYERYSTGDLGGETTYYTLSATPSVGDLVYNSNKQSTGYEIISVGSGTINWDNTWLLAIYATTTGAGSGMYHYLNSEEYSQSTTSTGYIGKVVNSGSSDSVQMFVIPNSINTIYFYGDGLLTSESSGITNKVNITVDEYLNNGVKFKITRTDTTQNASFYLNNMD